MRGWVTNIVLLAAVIGLGWYAYTKPDADKEVEHPIAALAPAQVSRLSIERLGASMALEKRDNHWYLTSPLTARADSGQVNRLIDVLSVKSKEKLGAADLARFDLDAPALTLRFGKLAIAFGTTNSLTQDQYVLSNNSVYLIPGFYRMQVPDRPDRLLTHSLFAEGEKPVGFELPQMAAEQKDGKWTVLRAPEGQPSLGADDLNRWADDWRFSSSLITQPYDGTAGMEQVRVKLADGKTLEIEVLRKEPDLVLARRDESLQFQYSTEAGKRLMAPEAEKPATPAPPTEPASPTPAK